MNLSINIYNSFGFICCLLLGSILIWRLIVRYLKKDRVALFSPITFIEIVFLFYVIIAPLWLISNQDYIYGNINMYPYICQSWKGALLSYLSILLGYECFRTLKVSSFTQIKIDNEKKMDSVYNVGLGLVIFGTFVYWVTQDVSLNSLLFLVEENINEFESTSSGYSKQMLSFAVPGVSLMFYACLMSKTSLLKKIVLVLVVCFVVALFLVAGSRYRLVYLLFSCATIYSVIKNYRPNLIVVFSIVFSLIFFFGIIGTTRNYHMGLNLSQLETNNNSELMGKGLNDTRIFYSTGALMNMVDKEGLYVHTEPLYTALCMPIPRSIFKEKPNAEYLREANMKIFSTVEYGIAFMNYGEAYYAFGWLGILLNGVFIGILSAWIYNKFRLAPYSVMSLLYLALFNGLIYVIISRGYFAQQVTTAFMYILIPMFIFKKVMNKYA